MNSLSLKGARLSRLPAERSSSTTTSAPSWRQRFDDVRPDESRAAGDQRSWPTKWIPCRRRQSVAIVGNDTRPRGTCPRAYRRQASESIEVDRAGELQVEGEVFADVLGGGGAHAAQGGQVGEKIDRPRR